MAESKLVSGFECEFVEKPPKAFQTECLICLLVLREPYQVICCGKSFCRSCIQRYKALNNPCPHCNEKNFTNYPNIGLQQSLYQLKIRCTHKKEGCRWTGELGILDSHLNLDSQPANQLEGCVFVTVKCTHCSESYQRRHINHHQSEECPKRPFTCEHCKDYESTYADVTTNHWSVCGCYPVPCSNKCGPVLQRQNIESHVAKDCPLTVIECDFHYAGCKVRLPRKDMGKHLRVELVTHTSMTAVSYQQQIASHQQQITSQQQQISSQQQQIASHQQQISSQQQQIASHQQQISSQQQQIASHQQQISSQQQQIASQQQQIASQQQHVASYKMQQDQDRQRMGELVKDNEAIKQRVAELEREQEKHRSIMIVLHPESIIPPVNFIMPNFEQHKENYDEWFSPPFYTHHRGYKLCLKCNGTILFTHVSVFIYMMRGEFDDELKWPFSGQVTIQLLSQDGSNEHHTKTITLNDPLYYLRITEGDRGRYGCGDLNFISHDVCNKRYIKDNSLHFRIVKVSLL